MDIGRELSRINNVSTLLKVLMKDLLEYCNEENKDDFGAVMNVNEAIGYLDDATVSLKKMQNS